MFIVLSIAILSILLFLFTLWYIREKARFIVHTVIENTDRAAGSAWATRTLDAYVERNLILPLPNPWTLDAAAIATLCKTLERKRPKVVLELGSGLSTIIIASFLRKNGGMLISVDHDKVYAEKTKEYLIINDLLDFVDLRIAPISKCDNNGSVWYDESIFKEINDVEALIIDGPPVTISADIRMHALRVLAERMAPGGFVIFDDVDRMEERNLVDSWRCYVPGSNVIFLGSPKVHALLELP